VKRVFKISAWIFAAAYLILVLAFVENEYENVLCKGVDVRIYDSLEYSFISPGKVRKLISEDNNVLAGTQVSSLNTGRMETILRNEQCVQSAQVYTTIEGLLIVEITQRKPVIKVMDKDHKNFYLDSDGNVIPPVPGYSPHILLANGHINNRYRKMNNVILGESGDESSTMESLLDIASLIASDPFWSSQIVQIYINIKGEFELIPRVGSHIILFGTGDQIENKFFKLRTLYDEGLSREGWNQYEIINLKYNKQVICTKR
jgi:cell division protein FtsQ